MEADLGLMGQLVGLGILVGLGSSILAIGGGLLLVPLLPLVTSLNQSEAVATSLATIFLVTLSNLMGFWRRGLFPRQGLLPLSFGAAVLSALSGALAGRLPSSVLEGAFLLLLLGLFWGLNRMRDDQSTSWGGRIRVSSRNWLALGACAGTLSGLTGVGSGLVVTPWLLMRRWVEPSRVVPIVNGLMMLTSGFAALGHSTSSPIRWSYALSIGLAAQLTSRIGVGLQERLSISQRRLALQAVIVILFLTKGVQFWIQMRA